MFKWKSEILLVFFILLLISNAAKAKDSLETERHKYIRNSLFNDSYLDVFFRTSPGALPMNSMYIDDNLIYKRSLMQQSVPVSRTRLSKRVDFFFDGVPIYNIFSGDIDLSSYIMMSNFFYVESINSDTSGRINIGEGFNFKPDTNLRISNGNINIGAGNQLGSVGGHFFTAHKYLQYFVSASYVNSQGIPLSDERPNDIISPTSILRRSGTDNGSIFGKVYFNNGDSQVGISAFFSSGNKTMPAVPNSSQPLYYTAPDISESLINFEFSTNMEKVFILKGNIFYKNSSSKLRSFDDSTYSTQNKALSFNKFSSGYNYGGNFSGKFEPFDHTQTIIAFNYIRDIINRREDDNAARNRYEIENFDVSLRQMLNFNSFAISATAKFAIKKPLFSDIAPINEDIKTLNFRLDSKYILSNTSQLLLEYSIENIMPSMQEIFYQGRFSDIVFNGISPEKEQNFSFGRESNYSDYNLTSKIYFSSISNIIKSEQNLNKELKFFNSGQCESYGVDLGFKVFADYGYISVNYTFSEMLNAPDFFAKPKHLGEVKIYNVYKIGVRWLMEAEYYSNNYFWRENLNNINTRQLFLLNFRLGIRIFSRNELFLGMYNILDSYYESEYGLPGSGMSFFMGVNINL